MVPNRVLKTQEVADLFVVDTNTVNRWADQGRLPHFRTPGGHRRFYRSDVEPLLQAHRGRVSGRQRAPTSMAGGDGRGAGVAFLGDDPASAPTPPGPQP